MAEDDNSDASTPELDNWLERELAGKIPAIFTNRMFVQPIGGDMLRVSFAETVNEASVYHASIVVSAANAVEFAHLLYNMGTALLAPAIQVQPAEAPEGKHGDG